MKSGNFLNQKLNYDNWTDERIIASITIKI